MVLMMVMMVMMLMIVKMLIMMMMISILIYIHGDEDDQYTDVHTYTCTDMISFVPCFSFVQNTP